MRLDRRGFLFGITATGALAAMPLPAAALLGPTPPSLADMTLRIVGPIVLGDKPLGGHLPLNWEEIRAVAPTDEIDIDDLASSAHSFGLYLTDPSQFSIRGWASPEIKRAFRDTRSLKSSIVVGCDQAFSFECIVINFTPLNAA